MTKLDHSQEVATAAKRVVEGIPKNPLDSFARDSIAFREQYSNKYSLSAAEVAKFNYCLRSKLQDATGYMTDPELFVEVYGVYPKEFIERSYGDSLDTVGFSTDLLFRREAERGERRISELEETARDSLGAQEEGESISEVIMEGALDRHFAASVLEAVTDGQKPQDVVVLLAAARRLELNGDDNFNEVLRGIVDAEREGTVIDKEVAEIVMRAVIEYGRVGHWPVDMLSNEEEVVETMEYQGHEEKYIRGLPSYDFGVALGFFLDESTRDAVRKEFVVTPSSLDGMAFSLPPQR